MTFRSGGEGKKIEQIQANLETIILMEEISWRQKSKALWLKDGG